MILKTCSRSKVRKGPYRSTAHLARVRAEPCLVCGGEAHHAHHIRECFTPSSMGVRIGDEWTVPLCARDHDAMHRINSRRFWAELGVDPVAWCASFKESKP